MSPLEENGLAGEAGRSPPRLLPIADLDLCLVKRVREALSESAIEDYALDLAHLPPIRVALVDGRPVVIGGLHRIRAHEGACRTEILCIIEPMTWVAAVQAAVGDNKAHGLRMTGADKRAAIRLVLDEMPSQSSRAIADLVGCSHSTVEAVRTRATDLPTASSGPGEVQVANLATCSRPETEISSPEMPPPPAAVAPSPGRHAAARKGRDGKTYHSKSRSSGGPALKANSRLMSVTAPVGVPALPVNSPAHLIDFRRGVQWVVQFLNFALHSPAREHRAEALDELCNSLTVEELRRLAAWVEEAAGVRGAESSRAGAAAAVH